MNARILGFHAAAFAILGFALALPAAGSPRDAGAVTALDDKAPTLPVAVSFEKSAGEDGPYILSLKNTSDGALKVSAKILLSVYFHADSKARNVPEHTIDPGQVWTIPGLAANDKIAITAAGFAPLELTVP